MSCNAAGRRTSYAATGAGGNLSQAFRFRGGDLAQVSTSGSQISTKTYPPRLGATPPGGHSQAERPRQYVAGPGEGVPGRYRPGTLAWYPREALCAARYEPARYG